MADVMLLCMHQRGMKGMRLCLRVRGDGITQWFSGFVKRQLEKRGVF
jgi:hypothetical protein